MKIYALYNELKPICITDDISNIRKVISDSSIFNPNESYPVLEIWVNGIKTKTTEGSDVLKEIARM